MNFRSKEKPNDKAVDATKRHIQRERRSFLDMVGKTGIASSALRVSSLLGGVMTARYAQAQESPKRVVFCYVHSGAPANDWRPSSATNMAGSSYHYGPASHNIASYCRFRGVDTQVSVHGGARQALGGGYSGNTIDADLGSVLGATSYYSTMFLGSNATDAGTGPGIIISSAGQPIESPRAAVENFFGELPELGSDDTYLKSFQTQRNAIDAVKKKLSVEEQQRLSAHLSALEKLESRIVELNSAEAPDLNACKPNITSDPNESSNAGMVEHGKLQAEVIVAAFKCDITRVATLQVGNHQGGGWTYRGFDGHGAAHSGGASVWNAMMTEKFEIPAYLVKRLSEEKDSNGQELIKSTAFCQVSCGGNGLSHSSADAPFMLATAMQSFGGQQFNSKGTDSTAKNFFAEVAMGLGVDPAGTDLGVTTGKDVGFGV